MKNKQQDHRRALPNALTAFELRVAIALMGCPESRLYQGGEQPSLAKVGALMGLSRERIRQIEARALRRLRTRMLHDAASARLVRKLYAMTNEN